MLYLVQPGGDAIRYGVGIGKDGFLWSGRANIQYGREWPTWTPPPEMIAAQAGTGEMAGRPARRPRPTRSARARSTSSRTARTPATASTARPNGGRIGQAMSSGCVRLINQDIIDLYSRVSKKNPVVVM